MKLQPRFGSHAAELTASWPSVAQRDMLRLDALIMTVQLNIRRLLEARPLVGRLLRFAVLGHTVTSVACYVGILWERGSSSSCSCSLCPPCRL